MKMDDEPTNLDVFANIAMRAYTIGRTPPMGPTLLVVDSELQEAAIADPSKLTVPRLTIPSFPQGDAGAVREAARLLATAERPLIRTGKLARTSAGWDLTHRACRAAASARRRRRLRLVAGLPVVARVVRLGRPRLPARRDPRPRAERHDGVRARKFARRTAKPSAFALSTSRRVTTSTTSAITPRSTSRSRPTAKRRCRR